MLKQKRTFYLLILFILSISKLLSQIELNDSNILTKVIIKKKDRIIFYQNTSDTTSKIALFDEIKWEKQDNYSLYVVKKGKKKGKKNYVIHYLGIFSNGLQFDNSFLRQEPLKFNIEKNYLLDSFVSAIKKIKTGGIALIKIDPQYGYGSKQTGNIPSNTTLYYLVNVININ